MDKCNSVKHDFHETPNTCPNLKANVSNKQQFRLNKINEIKDYFLAKIRELISKNIMKYIASLDYVDHLHLLSIAPVIGAPAGILGASCGLTFSITS